ncbi:hypothetical protein FW796_21010 [Pseudomonas sp. 910_21]
MDRSEKPPRPIIPRPNGADRRIPCRSRLAGEEAHKPCIALEDTFAGKPAPTRQTDEFHVGAGLPAKRPTSPASPSRTPSLASQLLLVR